MTDGLGTESYTYDQLGRRTQVQKVIYNVTYTTSYTYNLAGEVVNMTYPSGRVVKNNYDAIGRTASVQNYSNSAYYASSISYDAGNDVTGFTYGNGVVASYGYSAERLLLTSLSYVKGGTTLLSLSFGYTQNGGNDGQITGVTDSTSSGRTASYTHDAMGRLTAASTSGSSSYPAWGLSWTYDRYGNRTAQSVTTGSGPSTSPTVSSSTNQISSMGGTSFTFDANGNLKQDDLYKYVCDAENRLVEIDHISGGAIGSFAYDGNSNRTVKIVSASRTYYLYSDSQLISEFDDAASNSYSSGTTPGGAVDDYYATLLYHHQDQISTRLTTDNSGLLSSWNGHYPFGESWYAHGTADPSIERKYGANVREVEVDNAQLHYAMSRFISARNGQFQTLASGSPGSGIQATLNPYVGASNDPVNSYSDSFGDPFPAESSGKPASAGSHDPPALMDTGGGPGVCADCGYGFGVVGGVVAMSEAYQAAQNSLHNFMIATKYSLDCRNPDGSWGCIGPPDTNAIIKFFVPDNITGSIAYAPQAPSTHFYTSDPLLKKLVGAVEWALYTDDLKKWLAAVVNEPPDMAHGAKPLNPAPTSTATCSLQSQGNDNTCSYSCVSGGPLFSTYVSTLQALQGQCALSNGATQCPNRILVKGLTPDSAKVSSCSM
jgi:hypothetical protein